MISQHQDAQEKLVSDVVEAARQLNMVFDDAKLDIEDDTAYSVSARLNPWPMVSTPEMPPLIHCSFTMTLSP